MGLTGLLLFLLIAVVPVGLGLVYAGAYSVGATGLLRTGLTLAAWRSLLGASEIWQSVLWSAYVAAATVLATVLIALPLSAFLGRAPNRRVTSFALYVPLAMPATVAAFLVFHLLSGAGTVARIGLAAGLIERPDQFPSPIHDRFGVGIVLAHLVVTIPFFVLLLIQVHQDERVDRLVDLGRSLGGSRVTCFFRIEIPVLLARARTNLVLLFLSVLGAYEIPLLLGRGSPEMLSVLTLRKLSHYDLSARPEAYVAALLYTAFATFVVIGLARARRESDG